MTALVFDAARESVERRCVRRAARLRRRLDRRDVRLQHLQIVQPAERVLHALDRPDVRTTADCVPLSAASSSP